MTCKIKKVTHPFADETLQARIDEAVVTGQPLVERPFYYQNIETGQKYYALYGCIGWPSEVSDVDNGMPGYIAVVAAVKPEDDDEEFNPKDAKFQLLAEFENKDVPTLLKKMVVMRAEWGFGLHPDLLQTWTGDSTRFQQLLALMNASLTSSGGSKNAIMLSEPNDFGDSHSFDHYVRSFESVVLAGQPRFYFGGFGILKSKLREFKRDNPAVMAIGGLVHSMLLRCMWLDPQREAAFVIEDETDKEINRKQKEGGSVYV